MSTFDGTSIFSGTVRLLGDVLFGQGVVNNAAVKSGASIDADKLKNRKVISLIQDAGSDVVAQTKVVHLARSAGTVKSIEVRPFTAPTGGDKQFTVDVKKAVDASGSFATLLSAVITVDNSSVDYTRQQGTLIGSPAIVDGDAIQIVIAVSGSTGSQGDGVIVTVNLDEEGT